MFLSDLERFVNAFLDRHGWNNDYELSEAKPLVELKNGAEVNIGLTRPCLHFHREVTGSQSR